MAGRAGRRGIDEVGYFLVSGNGVRLREGYPAHLSRSGMVDWATLLGIMSGTAEQGADPFRAAVQVQERLFTTKPIHLGVESSLKHPNTPCGLKTDAERARHVKKSVRQFLNSRGGWQGVSEAEAVAINDIYLAPKSESPENTAPRTLKPLLSDPIALENVGPGAIVELSEPGAITQFFGKSLTLAEVLEDGRILLTKSLRRQIKWKGRHVTRGRWQQKIVPLVESRYGELGLPVVGFHEEAHKISVLLSLSEQKLNVPVDDTGGALWNPEMREINQPDCMNCELTKTCRELSTATGTALLWKRMHLVDDEGVPTRRGRVISFFSQGVGLAVAAALEDVTYPLEELIYDLANLDAGFRFCSDEDRFAGRLAMVCREKYGNRSVAGYLENGLPPKYGSGAETVVANIQRHTATKHSFVSEWVGDGDIDRVIIEWRSLMRQITHAPDLAWDRWMQFKKVARQILDKTESPTLTELPRLSYLQSQRVEHYLELRRH
jgi:hypothetical protein